MKHLYFLYIYLDYRVKLFSNFFVCGKIH